MALSLVTVVVFSPDYLTNTGILRSLFTRAENERSVNLGFMGELTALHLRAVFYKSTLLLGFLLLAGYVAGLTQWRRRAFTLRF
jgi:hypothetical protein